MSPFQGLKLRLTIKQDGEVINELKFNNGPVNIGRHTDSQVHLPERRVSRHHAVIYKTPKKKWVLEDLDSTNKTYLNGYPVKKKTLKTDDVIKVDNFVIEVDFKESSDSDEQEAINLQDTLEKTAYGVKEEFSDSPSDTIDALTPQTIVRRINHPSGPDIKLPIAKVRDFMNICEAVCKGVTLDEIKDALITTLSKQMSPSNCWCALRDQPSAAMAVVGGKKRDGKIVKMESLVLRDRIDQVIQKQHSLLFPRLRRSSKTENIHSAIIAPIVGENGCYGVVYIDNDRSHEHYNLSDLDYLTLVLIHTAVVIENF